MLDENIESEITDINEWADDMLNSMLEHGITCMIVKEA